ncbi:MAG: YbaB/EbfC family nucleoid-associated protein [Candidatus Marinimicrobia bacterium]|jgi:hypothetical protein|nr:YbaB/EbfC family nucleoid-associated protein [Candidatus Neomarinimicrobiota bacterium]MBT3618279.1 YbaB/EbfC family nucleoid-associated protein [Candidatus Neomarinimicrobiota bacterium]MBT3828224.1 YbaB/EbfC family nucleoid-associated protein [Candidatus Neomarinimicrobiota bacterium]MBT3997141.1 YbaB/EbfC family nucleoid-associated protein [Candidatus Neomarinimicrobiota bacterium]MBT4280607.1 YbaB/EbfC family nucleoid-associated protein [Candidatus Neomarinimicrobiota bacterium]
MFNKGQLNKMKAQAVKMQAELESAHAELADLTVEADAGSGLVTAIVNGKHELLELKLKPELLSEEVDMAEDLILSAVNKAMRKADDESKQRLNSIAGPMMGGSKIPGM